MADIFTEVTVDLKEGRIVCRPDPVQLYYRVPQGPNAVRWVKGPTLAEDMRIEIGPWQPRSPFSSVSTGPAGDAEARGNLGVAGEFKYTVTILRGGAAVATLDPVVRNDPQPGGP